MSAAYIAAAAARRTYYGLTPASPISKEAIVKIVEDLVKYVPSAFNTQTGRAVVVFGEHNAAVWKTVADKFLPGLGSDADAIALHTKKIEGYAGGYGSVLFFEEQATVDNMVKAMPGLAPLFPLWSTNSAGALQIAVWTALEAEGLGANLQHHHDMAPGITESLAAQFDLPATWKATAFLPFGTPVGPPGNPARPKEFLPIETRVKSFGL